MVLTCKLEVHKVDITYNYQHYIANKLTGLTKNNSRQYFQI
jgi:hypothetical protein